MYDSLKSRVVLSSLALLLIFLSPIKAQTTPNDDYIVCSRSIPNLSSWPTIYSSTFFKNNLELCSAVFGLQDGNNRSRNVGCACPNAEGPPACNLGSADSQLFNWPDTDSEWNQPLVELCQSYVCACVTEAYVDDYIDLGLRGSATFEREDNGVIYQTNEAQIAQFLHSFDDGDDGFNIVPQSVNSSSEAAACVASCTGAGQCATDSPEPQCECVSTSASVVPGAGNAGVIKHYGACSLAELDRKGRRRWAQQRPCICNASYVSYGCCGVRDGMIWEGSEGFLGEVWLGDIL